jgi:hypothetical protein
MPEPKHWAKERPKMYPDLDSLSNAYLQWMFDNQPEYVKEFLDQDRIGELDQILINQLASALRFIDILMKSGRSRYEAEDIAIEVLLAPADGRAFSDNPPEPLSLDDQEKIYRKLERRQEILDLLGELPKKRPPKE